VNKRIALIVVTVLITAAAIMFYVSRSKPAAASSKASNPTILGASSSTRVVDRIHSDGGHKYMPAKLSRIDPARVPIKPKATYETPAQLVREVEAEANSGSASAMYMMQTALKRCSTADMRTDQEIEATVAKRSLGKEAMDRDAGRTVDEEKETQHATNNARYIENLRDECKQLPAEQIASWKTLLQRSAEGGDPEARTAYAHAISEEFKDPQYLLENYDEFKRQNDLANSYLQDSIANGDCGYMVLNGFRWVKSDPTSTYVYQSLLLKSALTDYANHPEIDARTLDSEIASLNATLKDLALHVPADQLGEADAAANYILQNVCEKTR
jgi:hypothetical protein